MHYSHEPLVSSPKAVAVTPSDSTNLSFDTRAIYVGTSGNVVAVFCDDSTVTFANVPAGTILPIIVKRINSTSTTASNIVAIY